MKNLENKSLLVAGFLMIIIGSMLFGRGLRKIIQSFTGKNVPASWVILAACAVMLIGVFLSTREQEKDFVDSPAKEKEGSEPPKST